MQQKLVLFGHLSMIHLLLLRHRLRSFSLSVLEQVDSYSDAVGGSPQTLLLFYSLFATRKRINVSFSVSAEAVVKAQRHVSLQVFLQHLFSFSAVTFTCPRRPLHGGGYCSPMSYKSSLESSCFNVQLIRTVHSAVFNICCLAFSYNHSIMLALNHGISRLLVHIFFTSNGMFKILHVVSKRSKSFRQSNSCNCSFVGVSCLLFSYMSFQRSYRHHSSHFHYHYGL